MAKTIPLTKGKSTTVSDEDYDYLMQWKWSAMRAGHCWYAQRSTWDSASKRSYGIFMHRIIAARAGLPRSARYDHEDCDGLNNQRENIRPCSASQNRGNSRKGNGKLSRFKGVTWHKKNRKWQAQIHCGEKFFYLGQFTSEESAHQAYAAAARVYYLDFARP